MTKEELTKLYLLIYEGLTKPGSVRYRNMELVACRALLDLRAEFERYIDVLEPLVRPLATANAGNYYDGVIELLQKKYWSNSRCGPPAETIRRACDLIDTKKKPVEDEWKSPQAQEVIYDARLFAALTQATMKAVLGRTKVCSCDAVTSKRWLYCPHCGKEVE